jgi:HSP20 family protein
MTLLMRPEPFSTEFGRLFDSLLGDYSEDQVRQWTPAMDLVEGDDHFLLKADLPGLGEEDVAIEVRDNTLRISGERRSEHERKERGFHRVERAYGRFSRSLTLPEGVDGNAISARFDRGVLEVRVPKPEERKPRRIEIQAGDGSAPAVEGTATERSDK